MRDFISNKIQSCNNDLIDHPSLAALIPHFLTYYHQSLVARRSGHDNISASTIETYASNVFERVAELDMALASLRLTWQFITDLGFTANPSPEIFRYHYENFILRVVGIVDRAHLLVGVSLLLPSKKMESINGNFFVRKVIKEDYPDVHKSLVAVMEAVHSYRGPRNELVHSSAHSSRELGLFIALEQFSVDTGEIDLNELKRDYSAAGAWEIEKTIESIVSYLKALLDELAPFFMVAHESNSNQNK